MTDDTRKPVEELSGRELDASVAEEVTELEGVGLYRRVGWQDATMVEVDSRDDLGRDDSEHFPPIEPKLMYKPAPHLHHVLPHYSTDIAAAWEVVDEMNLAVVPIRGWEEPDTSSRQLSGWLAMPPRFGNGHDGHGELPLGVPDEGYGWTGGAWFADTAPEAICRAALKAVRGVDGE